MPLNRSFSATAGGDTARSAASGPTPPQFGVKRLTSK
jgi:hypothetical protein